MENQTEIAVALFTPYLYESLGHMKSELSEKEVKDQIEKYGFDPANFNGEKFLLTPKHKVVLETPDDHASEGPDDVALAIFGSTKRGEASVRTLKGSGLITARFSIFYGGPSKYTGSTPEDAGYALDMPKDVETVRKFLTNEAVLDAIVSREDKRIREAIDELNKELEQPVIVTPYLERALQDMQCRKCGYECVKALDKMVEKLMLGESKKSGSC